MPDKISKCVVFRNVSNEDLIGVGEWSLNVEGKEIMLIKSEAKNKEDLSKLLKDLKDIEESSYCHWFKINCDDKMCIRIDKGSYAVCHKEDFRILEEPINKISVNDRVIIKGKKGKVVSTGKYREFDCCVVEMDEKITSIPNYRSGNQHYLFPSCAVEKDEMFFPEKVHIYTYIKQETDVIIKGKEGKVKGYAEWENKFKYKIEIGEETKKYDIDEVKLKKATKELKSIEKPEDYGIITPFKLKSMIIIEDNKYGVVSWMGFHNYDFKFGLSMLDKFPNGTSGKFEGRHLFNCEEGCGILKNASEVNKFDTSDEKTTNVPIEDKSGTQKCEQEQVILNKIKNGEYGIQGHRNSCYLDTSLFVMYAFVDIFDFIFDIKMDGDADAESLRDIIRYNIVYPLRRDKYVDRHCVEKLRVQLHKKFPEKKFYLEERDPEEFIETLFLFLAKDYPFYTTYSTNGNEQNGFCMQVFYTESKEKISITDMLDLSFKEQNIKLKYPPKCLILQLPRNSIEYKNFEEVDIAEEIDITKFVLNIKCNENSSCTYEVKHHCRECSKENNVLLLCDEHKDSHSGHDLIRFKNVLNLPGNKKSGTNMKVKLRLIGVLCIYRAHYTAYVKTGLIDNKWIYFNSMEDMKDQSMVPIIRETELDKYFSKNEPANNKEQYETDKDKLTKYAFVCFYVNPNLEPYAEEFNKVRN